MIDDVLDALRCPHCAQPLSRVDGSIGCPTGHRFDVAKQGYVSLLGARSRTDTGDSAEMVAARVDFLAAGHYAPIAEAVNAAIGSALSGTASSLLVEIGAGTGYYLASALDAVIAERPAVAAIALDSSSRAARRAAGAHPRIGSVVADGWAALPVAAGCAAAVISIFAPRNPSELRRIVAADGVLITVTPTVEHLAELIGPLGMLTVGTDKDAKLAVALDGFFVTGAAHQLRFDLQLTSSDVRNLVLMGPAARHVDRAALDATLAQLPLVTHATAAVTVSCWEPA